MFERNAFLSYDLPALAAPDRVLTYRALHATVCRWTARLHAAAADHPGPVAIFSHAPHVLVPAVLACLRLGRVFVPIDPRLPQPRIDAMLEATKASLVVHGHAEVLPHGCAPDVPRLTDDDAPVPEPASAPPTDLHPDTPAYIYFSSGSTGTPKPILGRAGALAHYFESMARVLRLPRGIRVAQWATPSFDAGLREIFLALLHGGTLVAPPADFQPAGPPDKAAAFLAEARIDLVSLVPSVFRNLMRAADLHARRLPRTVLLSGEKVMPEDVARWYAVAGRTRGLFNLYGPTETTLTKMIYPLRPRDASRDIVPIGKPLAGVHAWIAGDDGRPLPPGQEGCIMLQTPFTALGYAGRPGDTAAAFTPGLGRPDIGTRRQADRAPFCPGTRAYRTGDQGYLGKDGLFYILGRKDRQIKRNGVRVQPEELEAALRAHPAIGDAAALPATGSDGILTLHAWYTGPPLPDLRAWLAARLPAYLLPGRLEALPALPYLPNGKLDRTRLAATPPPRSEPDAHDAAAGDPRTALVCAAFARVLGLERVSAADDFFQLGGHSMAAIALCDALAPYCAAPPALVDIFRAPQPRLLAPLLRPHAAAAPAPLPQPRYEGTVFHPNAAQKRIWLAQAADPRGTTFNLLKCQKLEGPVDTRRLVRAWELINARHEALRSRFYSVNGDIVGEVLPVIRMPITLIDLGDTADPDTLLRRMARFPYHLETGRLCRLFLVRLDPTRALLALSTHHIITDAWAQRLLEHELADTYRQLGENPQYEPPPAPRPPAGFREDADVAQRLAVRAAQLAGISFQPPVPYDGPAPVRARGEAAQESVISAVVGTDAMTALCRRWGVTPFNFLLTTFALTLRARTGRDDLLVAVPWFNREQPDAQKTVGMLVETLPVRLQSPSGADLPTLLHAHREALMQALAAVDLPQHRLAEALDAPRMPGRSPWGRLSFNFLDFPGKAPRTGWPGRPYHQGAVPKARFELSMTLRRQGTQTTLECRYDVGLYAGDTARGLAHDYAALLEDLIGDPTRVPGAATPSVAVPAPLPPAAAYAAPVYRAPADPAAVDLAAIWCRILGVSRVGLDDDFFSLGGHSMNALQLADAVSQRFGLKLSLADLFRHARLTQQAALLHAGAPSSEAPTQTDARTSVSPGQQRLWSLARLHGDTAAYTMALGFQLDVPFCPKTFQAAYTALLRRQAELRARFPAENGRPVRAALAVAEMPLHVIDLRAVPEAFARVRRLVSRHGLTHPFNPASGPLLRTTVLVRGSGAFAVTAFMHHMIGDARSKRLFREELTALYEALRTGVPHELPPLTTDYAHYAASRAHYREETLQQRAAALADAPTDLPLPFDRPRAARPAFQGDRLRFELDTATGAALDALAVRRAMTPYRLCLGIFGLFLCRYAGVTDLCLGTPVGRRDHRRYARVIGFFADTLVLRLQARPDMTVAAFLDMTGDAFMEALGAADVPFEALVRALGAGRRDANPLFQVMFTFRQGRPRGQGRSVRFRRYSAKFDLLLNMTHQPARYRGALVYDSLLFDRNGAARGLDILLHLFQSTPHQLQLPVSRVPLYPECRRADLLQHAHGAAFPRRTRLLHDGFLAALAQTPEAPALRWEGIRISYAELYAAARHTAAELARLGVGVEDTVPVRLPRGPALAAAVLGILLRGAAFVPIHPDTPPKRLDTLLADLRPRACVGVLPDTTADRGIPRVPAPAPSPGAVAHLTAAGAVGRRPPEDAAAYVLYTSGSTGVPKGVIVAHGAIAALLDWADTAFGRDTRRRVLGATDLGFDVAVFEWFAAWHAGGCLLLCDDLRQAPAFTPEDAPTMACVTPSAARILVGMPEGPARSLTVNLAGESPSPSLVRRLLARADVAAVHNIYGPTEAAVYATWHPLTAEPDGHACIGKTIAGREAYVLDPYLVPCPMGVHGDLYLGGLGPARGFVGDAARTAARFVPDPFSGVPGARLYRTGDRVSLDGKGALRFHGRDDDQIKLRGFRIEPGEPTALLEARAEVRAAWVKAVHGHGGTRLAAYVVPAQPHTDTAALLAGLKAALAERLPAYMVPQAWVLLAEMPLTPSGKVDARRLPDPAGPAPRAYRPPTNPMEFALAEIWQDVLRVPRVGMDDSFFNLGGDSITAVLLAAEARRRGLLLQPRRLLHAPTIALCAPLTAHLAEPTQQSEPVEGPVALLPMQRRYLKHVAPHGGFFTQIRAYDAQRSLDAATATRALSLLADHHDALRARFVGTGAAAVQIFDPPGKGIRLTELHPMHASEAARRQAVRHALQAQQAHLLPGADHVMRALLVKDAAGDILYLVAHHLVVDGLSWRIVLEDFGRLYDQLRWLEPPRLPPKTACTGVWAQALNAHRQTLPAPQPAPPFALPLLSSAPKDAGTRGAEAFIRITWEADLVRGLRRDALRAYRMRPDAWLTAACVHALVSWTGADQIVIDLETHGREPFPESPDVGRTVGWFTQITRAVFDVSTTTDTDGLLKHVKTVMHGLAGKAPVGDDPEADTPAVLLNFMGSVGARADGAGHETARRTVRVPSRAPGVPRSHVLELNAGLADDRLSLRLSYPADALDPAALSRLESALRTAVSALAAHCADDTVGAPTPEDFPHAGMDQAELDALMRTWSPARRAAVTDLYPATAMQEGMLYHSLARTGAGLYVLQRGYTLGPDVQPHAWMGAWETVLARHDVLRTGFVRHGNRVLQVVHPHAQPLTVVDLSGVPEARRSEVQSRLTENDARRGFAHDGTPPLRLTLLYLGGNRWFHLTSLHHMLVDGWSLAILRREVRHLYRAACTDASTTTPLQPAPRYVDFLAARTTDLEADARFWQAELAGARPLRVLPGMGAADEGLQRVVRTVSPETVAGLDALTAQRGISRYTQLLAAWGLTLASACDGHDLLIGTTLGGRDGTRPGEDALVGLCIQTLPVRLAVSVQTPLLPWLEAVGTAQLQRGSHADVALPTLQGWSDVPAGMSLFDCLMIYENFPRSEKRGQGTGTARLVHSYDRAGYPLALLVHGTDTLALRLLYETSAVTRARAESLLQRMEHMLARLPHHLFLPLDTLLDASAEQIFHTPAPVPPATAAAEPLTEDGVRLRRPPATPLEARIAAIWAEVLEIPTPSVTDSFFALGGNSLLLIRCFAKMTEAFGARLQFADLFAQPTVSALAVLLAEGQDDTARTQGEKRADRRLALRRKMRAARDAG